LFVQPPERLLGVWGWAMGAWFVSGLYLCACFIFSEDFRERLLTRVAGFQERDEREELVTGRAARSVFLVTLGVLVAGGLLGMLRVNIFAYTRWKGGVVPPLEKVGPHQLRKGEVESRGFVMYPSLGVPLDQRRPNFTEREEGGTQYFYESGTLFPPEFSRTLFLLAALQVLLFHLFARRVRT